MFKTHTLLFFLAVLGIGLLGSCAKKTADPTPAPVATSSMSATSHKEAAVPTSPF